MNLHIIPDSKFAFKFFLTLKELSLLDKNKFIVGTPHRKLMFIKEPLLFAKFNSDKFNNSIGRTEDYNRVFIHQFSPLLYKWVAKHNFNELNWMIWGADLYNLPDSNFSFYESETEKYIKRQWIGYDFLYRLKVLVTNSKYKNYAYTKVNRVFTWMDSEYQFACSQLPTLKAKHEFFYYENETAYHRIERRAKEDHDSSTKPRFILGNSGTPTNNHLDIIKAISNIGINVDLLIPISYGDKKYIRYLKSHVQFYKGGKIEFIDQFMNFDAYLEFLGSSDGLIMNNIRPQGYGNIFLMMALGKPVFLNSKNISVSDLNNNQLIWNEISSIGLGKQYLIPENSALLNLFSHSKLLELYRKHFC
jgi:dTDP-N-acetylfucosamine:lipid II N-acetylfucosaminyltransferase